MAKIKGLKLELNGDGLNKLDEHLKKLVADLNKKPKVAKRISLRPAWKPLAKEMEKIADEGIKTAEKLKELTKRMEKAKDKFFTRTKKDLNDTRKMKYNRKSGKLTILAD